MSAFGQAKPGLCCCFSAKLAIVWALWWPCLEVYGYRVIGGCFCLSKVCRWAEPGLLLSGMVHSAGEHLYDMQLGFVAGGTFWSGSGLEVLVWPRGVFHKQLLA